MFRAYRIDRNAASAADAPCGRFVEMDEGQLDEGDVLIRVEYSCINHRDALIGHGLLPVRREACVAGSDLAGIVISSAAPRFRPGMAVMATGYELGMRHHGGYAERALLPGGWVFPVPEGMDCRDVMTIGSAGLAAAMAVTRMEENGLRPERGPVLVSGASGGVGSLVIDMLAGRGYEVVALTGKPDQVAWLESLGAARVMLRSQTELNVGCGLHKGVWAGAVDVLGGEVLAWMLASIKPGGVLASLGACESDAMQVSVLPFASRGICQIGVDTVYAGFGAREKAWGRIATDLRPRHLNRIMREVPFEALPDCFGNFMNATARGRTVVRLQQKAEQRKRHE